MNKSKKPVWILANPFYQYQNFKDIIEYSGWDFYSFYNDNKITQKDKLFYDLKGNAVNPDDLRDKYSVIILTSSNAFPKEIDVMQIAESRKVIRVSHGILGVTVDNIAGIPNINLKELYGVYPRTWECMPVVQERLDILKKKQKSSNARAITSHPYIAQIIQPLRSEIEKDSLGLLTSNCTSIGEYVKSIINGLELRKTKYDTIYVKRHPLASTDNLKSFEPLLQYANKLVSVPASSDKFDFFDKCETIVTGMSSTFVESNLRNNFFDRGQKIYALDETIRVGMEDHKFSEKGVSFNDWELNTEYIPWKQFDSMLELTTKEEIFNEFIDIILEIKEEIYTSLKDKNETKSNKCDNLSSGNW